MTERARYHHGDLRRTLLALATASIRAGGGKGFSLRGVARAAGVDVAAVYRHFRNKADLQRAVASSAFAELARRMEVARDAQHTPDDRFRAIGRAYVAFAVDEPALFRLAFGPVGAGDDDRAVRGEGASGRDPYQLLVDSLHELAAARPLAVSVDVATLPAWAAVHGLAQLLVDGALPPEGAEAAAAAVVDHVLRGLT